MPAESATPTDDREPAMNSATVTCFRRLRMISAPEAISFLLLLICSVLKRTTDYDFVMVLGMIHGVLFIGYVLLWLDSWQKGGWALKTAAWYLLMSVLPTGGFFAERSLRRTIAGATSEKAEPAAA